MAVYLDLGESEAIALALEVHSDWLLMDEREGRLLARRAGLRITGALGVLLKAKRAGRLSSLRAQMEALRSQARFFLRQDLEEQLLRECGEI